MRRHNEALQIDTARKSVLGSRIPLASLIQTIAIAEHLTFRHAPNALGITQSIVSARIKAREEEAWGSPVRMASSWRPAH
jgi:hypothetical protein